MSFQGICSFCSSDVHINNENAESMTDTVKQILDLFINLDLGDRSHHAICNVCSERLLAAFEFKYTCMYTDATIIPYVDWEKPTQLNLWEIYLREKDNKQSVTLSEGEQVCRLCMELTGKIHVLLQDIDKDVFQKFLPEINLNILKDPVVCKICFNSLKTHSNFIRKLEKCIDQKEAITSSVCSRKMNHSDELLSIKTEEVDIKLEDKPSVDSCMQLGQIRPETEECQEMFIKSENIEIEFEYDQTSINSLVSEIHPVAFESKQQTTQTETGICKSKYGVCRNNDDMTKKDSLKTKLYKCDKCDYSSNKKRIFKYHQMMHKDPSEIQMFKCDICDYQTKVERYLKGHQLKHKDPSEVQMYECYTCGHKTKYRSDLQKHQLIHIDPSQVQMYECDICDYKTKFKQYLPSHQLKHKDPSEVYMHKCDFCDYETKIKDRLRKHLMVHKDPSQVRMYKCDICSFGTKYKQHLKHHQLMHKDPSQVQMFKCEFCDYETKFKGNLKNHLLRHRVANHCQVQMYKCDICSFETNYKQHLKHHQLSHKDPSQVQMYKCEFCDYETKFKGNLKNHLLRHRVANPSQVQMYKCYNCDFESTLEHLKRHVLTHEDWS